MVTGGGGLRQGDPPRPAWYWNLAMQPPATGVKPPAPRLEFIEGMRAAAALMVLLNHAYGQAWYAARDQFPPAPFSILTFSLATGHLAVSVFISISGYCLMLPVARGDGVLKGGAWEFFRRRVRRILPPYYAALLFSLLLIATIIGKPTGTLWDVAIAIRPSDLASHVLLLQHFFGTGRINYAFWSIALEWQIYFLFPALVLAFRRWGTAATVSLALAAGYAMTLAGIGHERIARANLHYLGLFVLGMLAAWTTFSKDPSAARLRRLVPWRWLALALFVLSVSLLWAWGWRASISRWPALDLIVSAGTCMGLIDAGLDERSPIRRLFSGSLLVWIGRFSYSLYLIHAPLLQVLWIYLVLPLGLGEVGRFGVLLLGGSPLIVLAALAFFKAFEAPFLKPAQPRARLAEGAVRAE
jgi:peptidoglycan/LPS O-acetylase OafA/YrhL